VHRLQQSQAAKTAALVYAEHTAANNAKALKQG
jgi:hypothetical protein